MLNNLTWPSSGEKALRVRELCRSHVAVARSAYAGPRDDMLAAISRCASVADEGTFLDCVYGVAILNYPTHLLMHGFYVIAVRIGYERRTVVWTIRRP
jgi:hypothetical protein